MIGVLDHPKIKRSAPLADAVIAWLEERGETVWRGSVWDSADIETHMHETKLLIALGGDGSILRAARASAPHGVPIFSVNLGKLGFLSEASPDDWQAKLVHVLDGQHRLEKRLLLNAKVLRNGAEVGNMMALNEVVVGRGRQARVLNFDLFVDGDEVTSYVADGLITATPTGSTAYALAAGGPILPPQLPNFVIVPVAPHLSLDRAIVLYEEAVVKLEVHFDHEATITADGQDALDLESGDTIVITKSAYTSLFTRVDDPSYFYKRLMVRGVGLRRD